MSTYTTRERSHAADYRWGCSRSIHSMEAPAPSSPLSCAVDSQALMYFAGSCQAARARDRDFRARPDPGGWMRNAEGKGRRQTEAREGRSAPPRSRRRIRAPTLGVWVCVNVAYSLVVLLLRREQVVVGNSDAQPESGGSAAREHEELEAESRRADGRTDGQIDAWRLLRQCCDGLQ